MAHDPYLKLLRDRELLGSMLRRIVADADSHRERGGKVCFDLDAARDVLERVGHLTGAEHFTRWKGIESTIIAVYSGPGGKGRLLFCGPTRQCSVPPEWHPNDSAFRLAFHVKYQPEEI